MPEKNKRQVRSIGSKPYTLTQKKKEEGVGSKTFFFLTEYISTFEY